MQIKYVIIKVEGAEVPIVFSELVSHASFRGRNPVSAGYINLVNLVSTYGKSDGLDLKPRPQDAAIIAKEFGLTFRGGIDEYMD